MANPSTYPASRSMVRLVMVAVLMLLALLLTAPSRSQASVQFGTWSPGEPYAGNLDGVVKLQNDTGRRVDIVNWYQNWPAGGVSSGINAVTASNRIPLLTWEPWDPSKWTSSQDWPYPLQTIVNGAHDNYIASFARTLRDVGRTVYLRPMHEMNGNWYPWSAAASGVRYGTTPGLFKQAWQRIVTIFRANSATNVKFVWSPYALDVPASNPMENYYPGSSYVDVLALDGYNWGIDPVTQQPRNGGWQTFAQLFDTAYDRLKALGPQPIWIAEVGSAPDGGDKAGWILDMWRRADEMDRVQAIVWFNENKEADWRANPTSEIASAFRPGATDVSYLAEVNGGYYGMVGSDLYLNQTKSTGSGTIEVHSATVGSGYQGGVHYPTYLSQAEANNGRFQMVGSDLYFIKTRNTGSGKIEVHSATAASGYQSGVHYATALPLSYADWATFQMVGPDLYYILTKAPTGSGKVEVHSATAASGYQSGVHYATAVPLAFANKAWFQMVGSDLYYILTRKPTGSGKVEVHSVTAASGYQSGVHYATYFGT